MSLTTMRSEASSDACQQVTQVRSGFGLARLTDLAVLDVTGPDAERFLQNRLSNDVLALQPDEGQLNAVLDRQAKIQGIFSLHRMPNGFRMLIDAEEAENAIAQILKFRIMEQVDALKITDVVAISLQGPQSQAFLEAQFKPAEGQAFPQMEYAVCEGAILGQTVWLVRRSFSGEVGYVLTAEPSDADGFYQSVLTAVRQAGGVELSQEAQTILRVEAGLPKYGMDYDFETLLPETGLEREAVSYSKGCYLGQETVARIKTYGMVQKALVGLLFEADAELPLTGSLIYLAGKEVGKLCSVVYSPTLQRPIAMAYLGKSERVPGKRLDLEINGTTYSVGVALLPLYTGSITQKSGAELLKDGLQAFSDGFDEEAIRIMEQAIEADSSLVEAYEALGVILSRHERYNDAIHMMNKVLELEPEHVLAHTNLSVFYMKLGDKDKAEEEKAKATMAAFSKKAKESGLVFDIEAERRKKEQATRDKIAMFIEALKYNPQDSLGNFGLGSAYLELKQYQDAIEPLEKTIQAQPKHSVAYLSLGKAFEGLQQIENARKTYEKGSEVAAAKGDLMPLKEMQARLQSLTSI
jgi:folate-binding protein YgfZ